MLTLLYQFILSFFASMGFGILFNAPRRALMQCGLTGAAGWLVYYIFINMDVNQILASFAGGIVLTAVSIFNSRKMKMPIVIFITCGIIPLVPGGTAYQAMRNVVLEDYQLAFSYGIEAALIASAIALGIITSEMIHSLMNTLLIKLKIGE